MKLSTALIAIAKKEPLLLLGRCCSISIVPFISFTRNCAPLSTSSVVQNNLQMDKLAEPAAKRTVPGVLTGSEKVSSEPDYSKDQTATATEPTPHRKPHRTVIPNYFVAVPVSNPAIHAAATLVQDSIHQYNPCFKSSLVSIAKLHITLMVLRLNDDAEIARAHLAMDSVREKLRTPTERPLFPLTLAFKGLKHFDNKVLYIKPAACDGLADLAQVARLVETIFAEHGLMTTEPKTKLFTPHLTVAKLTKDGMFFRRLGVKGLPRDAYHPWLDHEFGTETVTKIQLCSMLLPQDPKTSYYFCSRELSLID